MKTIYFISLLLLLNQTLMSQQSCDGFNSQTFQHTTSVWNWTNSSANNWGVYLYISPQFPNVYSEIQSPFESGGIGQPNTDHFYAGQVDRDYKPEDGWELVVKRFGINSPNNTVSNPAFILYNRYRSVMRIFICVMNIDGNYTGAQIELKWKNGLKASGLLESGISNMKALDAFSSGIRLNIPNDIAVAEGYQWLYADVPVNYDPCTCSSSPNSTGQLTPNISAIDYYSQYLISTSIMAQIDEVKANEQPRITNGDMVIKQGNSAIKSTIDQPFQFLGDAVKKGNEVEKKITDAVNSVEQALQAVEKISKLFNKADSTIASAKKVELPSFLKQLPRVGLAFGILEFMITGGKKQDKTNATVPVAPKRYSLTGTLNTTGVLTPYWVYTPGSPHESVSGNQPQERPIYDYVLGIFSLLETPEIEWVQYLPQVGLQGNSYMPRIRQYRLKNPLKYAINPASQLEVVDIRVALEYNLKEYITISQQNDTSIVKTIDTSQVKKLGAALVPGGHSAPRYMPFIGPVMTKQLVENDYLKRLENSGVYIANWPSTNKRNYDGLGKNSLYNITYSTSYFNPICKEKYSFAIADYNLGLRTDVALNFIGCNGNPNQLILPTETDLGLKFEKENLDVKLKVRVILRRTDSDRTVDTEDIILVQTYDTKISNESSFPENGTYTMSSCMEMNDNLKFGKDYWVNSLSAPNGYQIFPQGEVEYVQNLNLPSAFFYPHEVQLYAREKITISSTQTAPYSNASYFRAGSEIELQPGTTINPHIVLEINPYPFGCENTIAPQSYSQIMAVCTDETKYRPNLSRLREEGSAFMYINSNETFDIFPNPTSYFSTIYFNTSKPSILKIQILDLNGKEIYSTSNLHYDSGEHEYRLYTENFRTGMYLVNLIDGENKITKKLAVVN